MFVFAGVSMSKSHSPDLKSETVVTLRYAPPQSYAIIDVVPESNVAVTDKKSRT